MAQGRFIFEVTFQSLEVTNIWTCDCYLWKAEHVSWQILCYMSEREGDNVLLKFVCVCVLFLISSFVYLYFWVWRSVPFLVKTVTYPQNYHTWSKCNLHPCTFFFQVPDFSRFRHIFPMKINCLCVSLHFQRPNSHQRNQKSQIFSWKKTQ